MVLFAPLLSLPPSPPSQGCTGQPAQPLTEAQPGVTPPHVPLPCQIQTCHITKKRVNQFIQALNIVHTLFSSSTIAFLIVDLLHTCQTVYSTIPLPPPLLSPCCPQVVLEDENTIENILIEQQPSPSQFRGLKHFNSNFAKVSSQ